MDLPPVLKQSILQHLPANEIIRLTEQQVFPLLTDLQYDSILQQDFGYTSFLEDVKDFKTQDTFERFKELIEVIIPFEQNYEKNPVNFTVMKTTGFQQDRKNFNKEFARLYYFAENITFTEYTYQPYKIQITDKKGQIHTYTIDESEQDYFIDWFQTFPSLTPKFTLLHRVESEVHVELPRNYTNLQELRISEEDFAQAKFLYNKIQKLTIQGEESPVYLDPKRSNLNDLKYINSFAEDIKRLGVTEFIWERVVYPASENEAYPGEVNGIEKLREILRIDNVIVKIQTYHFTGPYS